MRNRLRQAREERRISAVELAEKLQVHPSSVANWEAGRREIAVDNLIKLADILGFSVDYLLGRDIFDFSQTEPVDREALQILHGQPVWTASYGWMLVNIIKSAFVAHDLSLVPFGDIQEDIYLVPPTMSNSLRGVGKPLSLDAISERVTVWVEPITVDISLGAELRGWYHKRGDGRLVENEYGHRFYLDAYGVKWLAFEDVT